MSKHLDLERARDQHALEWKIQRIGWAIWGVILLAAVAGLLGSGPLSHRAAQSADGWLLVEYDRYLHLHSPASLRLVLLRSGGEESAGIFLSRSFLDGIEVQSVLPEPRESVLTREGAVLRFPVTPDMERSSVTLHYEPEQSGWLSGEVRLGSGGPVAVRQFVYP